MYNKTREEHIQWCKDRAIEQYKFDLSNNPHAQPDKAFANSCCSMLSDLSKHPDTIQTVKACAMLVFMVNDEKSLYRFINGFN